MTSNDVNVVRLRDGIIADFGKSVAEIVSRCISQISVQRDIEDEIKALSSMLVSAIN